MAVNKDNNVNIRKIKKIFIKRDMFQEFFGNKDETDNLIQVIFNDNSKDRKSEHITTIKPQQFLKTGDRISTDIVEGFKKGEAFYKIKNNKSKDSKPIVTKVSFVYKNVDIFAPKDGDDKGFTSLDKEVHDAIVSLYAAGNQVFTSAMVYRTMSGKSDNAFVPQEKLKEVSYSIYKCMSSIITIDDSEETKNIGVESIYSQNLIYAKAVTLKTKGWEVSAFMLIDEPVLYKYAKMRRQVFSVPLKILDSPPSKTNDVIVLQGYLMRLVETLRLPNTKASNIILYSTLYELIGCEGGTKQKLHRVRDKVRSILNYWLDIEYINDFTETVIEKTIYSLHLDVSPTLLKLKFFED